MTRDGIEWPAKKLSAKRKLLLIWRVIRGCIKDTIKTNDWLAIYEILLDGCQREEAASKEEALAKRISEGK